MATRSRTITVYFGSETGSVAAGTRRDLASKTIYIPETASRTFKSVEITVIVRDDETTSGKYVSSVLIGAKLGSAAFSDVTVVSSAIAQYNTFEHQQHRFVRDASALVTYFNTNFGSGTSQTMQVGVQIGGCATVNVGAIVEITYEYDDASATTLAGVAYIPLDGEAANLATSLTAVAGVSNNLPQLTGSGGLLNDMSSVTVRAISFVMQFQEAPTATTDLQLGMSVDSESEVLSATYRQNMNSGCDDVFVWSRDDLDPSTAHTLKVRSTVASRCNTFNVLMVVQYEYAASSTTVLRSLRIPLGSECGYGGSSSGDANLLAAAVYIEDPATVTLKQSGAQVAFANHSAGSYSGLTVQIGAQTARSYTHQMGTTSTTTPVGGQSLMQRFDSGGLQGSGLSFARGKNQITVKVYATAATPKMANLSGIAYLNYTCGVPAAGEGANTRTLYYALSSTTLNTSSPVTTIAATAPDFAETVWAAVAVGYRVVVGAYSSAWAWQLQADRQAGEGLGDGWQTIGGGFVNTGSGTSSTYGATFDASSYYARNSGDPDARRFGVKTSRQHRFDCTTDAWSSVGLFLTLSSIYFDASETAVGLDSPKNGVEIHLHTAPSVDPLAPRIASATTDTNGDYTLRYFDDTEAKFAHARQSSTKVGRSDEGTS